jgi:hypothetical protein
MPHVVEPGCEPTVSTRECVIVKRMFLLGGPHIEPVAGAPSRPYDGESAGPCGVVTVRSLSSSLQAWQEFQPNSEPRNDDSQGTVHIQAKVKSCKVYVL